MSGSNEWSLTCEFVVCCRSDEDINSFLLSVNIAAGSRVVYTLIYDELLARRRSLYQHVINIDPRQTVSDLQVKVNILESRPITVLQVPDVREMHENAIFPAGVYVLSLGGGLCVNIRI